MPGVEQCPSVYVCYRFTAKLREHKPLLDRCIASVVRALERRDPLLGWDVADRRERHARLREQPAVRCEGRRAWAVGRAGYHAVEDL